MKNDLDTDLQDPGDRQISAALRQHASRHVAPRTLRAGLQTQLAVAEAERSSLGRSPGWWAGLKRAAAERWISASLGFALGAACTALLVALPRTTGMLGDDETTRAAVALHVRALRDGPLVQVASSDRHTVKPWFQGRLDYAPTVLDLADQGFPLRGGRVDQFLGQTVAVLTYARRAHVIELVVRPADAPQALVGHVHRGFQVLDWAQAGMHYTAVSDLDPQELRLLAAGIPSGQVSRP